MWYIARILGVTMAVLLATISAMMCDARESTSDEVHDPATDDARQG